MKTLIFSALIMFLHQLGFSQDIRSAEESNNSDNLIWGKLTSTYREYFKCKEYESALDSWWTLYNDYPDKSEKLYVDGVTMYRHFIEETAEGHARNGKVDTLMLIYDQRMAYFGGEGNVLGRKGSDLLRFRSDDKEGVKAAYDMLRKSLDIEGSDSRDLVLLNCMAAALTLHQEGMIDNIQVLEDYFLVTGLLDLQKGSISRRERTRASIDGMVEKENILSCDGLDLYFGPQFEQNSEDAGLLEKIIDSYVFAGCSQSALYTAASEKLYEIDPGAESAHKLAKHFIGKNDLEKAAWYLQMAVVDGSLPAEKRAEWFYELSIVSLAKGAHCEAIVFAREAVAYKNDLGKAYIALGDACIACRQQLGDVFMQQSVYWAAADMYQTAALVDKELVNESSQKLAMCAAHYPSKEDIFFQDLKVGDSFRIGGCINENTTIRSSD